LRPVPAAGLTLLAYIFETILKLIPDPFGFRLPLPSGLLVASRETITAKNPLPGLNFRFPVCLRAAAPLQDLSILRDQCAPPDSNRERLPLRVARSSFAPRLAIILLVPPRNGSMFQIRYFPSAELLAPALCGAPFTNYFVLDPWLSLLPANCSALHFVCPVASTDLTRCRPLNALLHPQIAPRSIHCARAVGGSPRLTDHSVFST